MLYPYNSPVLLTDPIYIQYGGETGTSTTAQRQAAYTIAEERASVYLNTLLVSTRVTGTYLYHPIINLEYAHVQRVVAVVLLSKDGSSTCTLSETASCAYLRNAEYGLVDVNLDGCGGCTGLDFVPYQARIVYDAGLPTGTSTQPSVLMAMTIEATIVLREMIAALGGNESTGDIGVQNWSNQEYSEDRIGLLRTALGTSALSNYASHLLQNKRRLKRVGLGPVP